MTYSPAEWRPVTGENLWELHRCFGGEARTGDLNRPFAHAGVQLDEVAGRLENLSFFFDEQILSDPPFGGVAEK